MSDGPRHSEHYEPRLGRRLACYVRQKLQRVCKADIQTLFTHISKPVEISSGITRAASDIVSCGPAFMSYLVQRFIDAAVEETDITKEEAVIMSTEMLVGLGKLLETGITRFPPCRKKYA